MEPGQKVYRFNLANKHHKSYGYWLDNIEVVKKVIQPYLTKYDKIYIESGTLLGVDPHKRHNVEDLKTIEVIQDFELGTLLKRAVKERLSVIGTCLPSDFTNHPFTSIFRNREAENCAVTIMKDLATNGNKWRALSFSEHSGDNEKLFNSVQPYTISPEMALEFCINWYNSKNESK